MCRTPGGGVGRAIPRFFTKNSIFLSREPLIKPPKFGIIDQLKYDAIDYEQLDDDEAGDVGDEHEVVNGLLSMLKIAYSDTFE